MPFMKLQAASLKYHNVSEWLIPRVPFHAMNFQGVVHTNLY